MGRFGAASKSGSPFQVFLRQAAGFSLALLAMVLYSLYMVPRKRVSLSQKTFTWWMGVGILLSTLLIGMLVEGIKPVSVRQYLWIFGSGLLWATGTVGYSGAVKYIGLSRSTPIKNTAAILATINGVVIFHEFPGDGLVSILAVMLGSLAIVVSATVLCRVECRKDSADYKVGRGRWMLGIVGSFWAAIAYSAYTIPMKLVYAQGVSPTAFLFYMGQGCFVGMALIALFMKSENAPAKPVTWRSRNLAQLSGIMWAVGSLCANYAVKAIGVAVTWPLTKTTAVSVIYGVLVLKEVDVIRHKKDLRFGILLSIVGVVLLAYAVGRS